MTKLPLILRVFTKLVMNASMLMSFFFLFFCIRVKQHSGFTAWELFAISTGHHWLFALLSPQISVNKK